MKLRLILAFSSVFVFSIETNAAPVIKRVLPAATAVEEFVYRFDAIDFGKVFVRFALREKTGEIIGSLIKIKRQLQFGNQDALSDLVKLAEVYRGQIESAEDAEEVFAIWTYMSRLVGRQVQRSVWTDEQKGKLVYDFATELRFAQTNSKIFTAEQVDLALQQLIEVSASIRDPSSSKIVARKLGNAIYHSPQGPMYLDSFETLFRLTRDRHDFWIHIKDVMALPNKGPLVERIAGTDAWLPPKGMVIEHPDFEDHEFLARGFFRMVLENPNSGIRSLEDALDQISAIDESTTKQAVGRSVLRARLIDDLDVSILNFGEERTQFQVMEKMIALTRSGDFDLAIPLLKRATENTVEGHAIMIIRALIREREVLGDERLRAALEKIVMTVKLNAPQGSSMGPIRRVIPEDLSLRREVWDPMGDHRPAIFIFEDPPR